MIGVGYQFKLACSIRKIGEFPSWHRRGRCAKGAAGVVAHRESIEDLSNTSSDVNPYNLGLSTSHRFNIKYICPR